MKEAEKLGKGVKFERIRRITGYLTGSIDTWCNAKRAELRDRVNHGEKKCEMGGTVANRYN